MASRSDGNSRWLPFSDQGFMIFVPTFQFIWTKPYQKEIYVVYVVCSKKYIKAHCDDVCGRRDINVITALK